ncbi:MAG: hypothetical protein KBF11_06075 [Desulfomicrobium sp.]|nr:hypothetical protein [Desulfomicrobium sp.]
MKLVRVAGLLVVALLLSQSAWCSGLSAKDVQGFIASMQELKPYFDQFAEETEDDGDLASTSRVVSDWAQGLKERSDVEAIIGKHGFDFDSWAAVSQQVTQAYMAVKLGADGQDVMGQMRQSMAEIETNKDIPAEYKTQMITQMQTSMAEMEKVLKASPEDQDAVKPFVTELDSIFEMQE